MLFQQVVPNQQTSQVSFLRLKLSPPPFSQHLLDDSNGDWAQENCPGKKNGCNDKLFLMKSEAVVSSLIWVLGTELGSSGSKSQVFNIKNLMSCTEMLWGKTFYEAKWKHAECVHFKVRHDTQSQAPPIFSIFSSRAGGGTGQKQGSLLFSVIWEFTWRSLKNNSKNIYIFTASVKLPEKLRLHSQPPSISHNSLILKPDIAMSPTILGSEHYLTGSCFLW